MDIEGGEFPIIEHLMKKDNFNFKKGVIEFHLHKSEIENHKIFVEFLKFLKKKEYKYYFFSNSYKRINRDKVLEDMRTKEESLANIFFAKKERR